MFDDLGRGRTAWTAVGGLLALAVVFVLYSFVGTFVFAVFIYYATRPIYRRLRRRVRPASLAALLSLVLLVLPALALVSYAGLVATAQLDRLVGADARANLAAALDLDLGVVPDVRSPDALLSIDPRRYLSPEQALGLVGRVGGAVDVVAEVGIFLVHAFVMVAVAFYLLRDDTRIARWVTSRFGDDHGLLRAYLTAVDRDLSSIFFGNILNAVLTGTIGVIVYSTLDAVAPAGLGVPAPALVGALAGVASLIPIVGMKLVYVPVALYLAGLSAVDGFAGVWFVALFAGVSLVVVDTIPDLVLRPYVSGRNLHVGTVMIAYTLGPLLFGWYGLFLLPMVLVFVVHFARVVLPELAAAESIRPFALDPGATPAVERPDPEAEPVGEAAASRDRRASDGAGADE